MKVIDGAAFVNINSPRNSKTFGEYCKELESKVLKIGAGACRLDFVFDVYKKNSLKSQTRESRGKGTRVSVRKETPIPKDFQKFLRNDKNKTELF